MSDGEATPTRLAGDGDLATALQVHARRLSLIHISDPRD